MRTNQVKYLLSQTSRKNVYFSAIYSYINYDSIAWESTYKTKLKKIFTYQKKAASVISFADRLAHAKPLMLDMNPLNFYQINIYQNLILSKFSRDSHNYTSSKSNINYTIQFLNRQ